MKLRSIAVALTMLALTFAAPAGAATSTQSTVNGCTVYTDQPYHDGFTASGQKRVFFRVRFACSPSTKSIRVEQYGYDSDVGENSVNDVLLMQLHGPFTFGAGDGSGTWWRWIPARHWDGPDDDWVELYHLVRFKVCGGYFYSCKWGPSDGGWLQSPTTNFLV
jgi:hypothetical protein